MKEEGSSRPYISSLCLVVVFGIGRGSGSGSLGILEVLIGSLFGSLNYCFGLGLRCGIDVDVLVFSLLVVNILVFNFDINVLLVNILVLDGFVLDGFVLDVLFIDVVVFVLNVLVVDVEAFKIFGVGIPGVCAVVGENSELSDKRQAILMWMTLPNIRR